MDEEIDYAMDLNDDGDFDATQINRTAYISRTVDENLTPMWVVFVPSEMSVDNPEEFYNKHEAIDSARWWANQLGSDVVWEN